MDKFSKMSWTYVVEFFKSDENKGLSEEYIEEYNNIKKKERKIEKESSKVKLVLSIIFFIVILSFFVYLKAYVAFSLGLASLFVYYLNKKKNKQKDINKAKEESMNFARVIRSGKIKRIHSNELIPGDLLYVNTKEICPCDMRLIKCEGLLVEEGIVTGDYSPVLKDENKVEEEIVDESSYVNILFKGSLINKGSALGICICESKESALDSMLNISSVESIKLGDYKKRTMKLLKDYMLFDFYIALISFLIFIGLRKDIKGALYEFFYIFVSGIPMYIYLFIFLSFMIFKWVNKKEGIYIRDIFSIESISNIKIVMSDMVGVFTKEKYEFRSIFTDGKLYREGAMPLNNYNINRILTAATLCNRMFLQQEKDFILKLQAFGYEKAKIERKERSLFQIPYDKTSRLYLTVNKVDRNYRAYAKGDVTAILDNCSYILKDGVELPLTEKDIVQIKSQHMRLCLEGYDVKAYAFRNFNYAPSKDEKLASYLVFIGLISFESPLLDNIKNTIEKSRLKSVKPLIFTDLHKLSAKKIGKELGILIKDEDVLTGVQIDNMDEEELIRVCERISIICDVSKIHKERLLKALEKLSYVTAYCGKKVGEMEAFLNSSCKVYYNIAQESLLLKTANIYFQDFNYIKLVDSIFSCHKFMNFLHSLIEDVTFLAISLELYFSICTIMNFRISIDVALTFSMIFVVILALSSGYNLKKNEISPLDKTIVISDFKSKLVILKRSIFIAIISTILNRIMAYLKIYDVSVYIFFIVFAMYFLGNKILPKNPLKEE